MQMSKDDHKAVAIMEQTAVLNGNHYAMVLPWKSPLLPNDRVMALHRLMLLKKRFHKDPGFFSKYSQAMDDHLLKGYTEQVPESLLDRSDGMVWYHPVFHPDKPDKIRVVFDCAAKFSEVSLNDKLLQGLDFTNILVGVMTRFRQESIGLISHIESMFHQLEVAPDHCDALSFLWWPGNDMEREPQDYQLKVFPFGAVCSPSCAGYALRRTAQDNEGLFPLEVIETVNMNFYVDDCLKSVTDEDSAVSLVPKLGQLSSSGGFHLTKWVSNSSNVLATIPESERAKSVKDLQLGVMPSQRALGVKWNLESDTFGFKVKVKGKPPTRRGILSLVS